MPLNQEQKQALEAMVTRRVRNTGETRAQAAEHIANYLQQTQQHNADQ